MKKYKIGDKLSVHSYKHDGKIHKSWDEAVILDETDDFIVFGNERALVTEADGRDWRTGEPAVMYFFKNKWFNVIGQIKKRGIYYYCNIASPFIIEEDTVKYIDYDLDLRVFPNYKYRVLDEEEYIYHSNKMKYPEELKNILISELDKLIEMMKRREGPFNKDTIRKYHEVYKKYKKTV